MPITGFHRVSLFKILSSLGTTPSTNGLPLEGAKPLEAIIKTAERPVVVFPECTTSNGRGLLRFADVFDPATPVPVRSFRVLVMCARYVAFSLAVLRPINGASAFQIWRPNALETHRNIFDTQLVPNSDTWTTHTSSIHTIGTVRHDDSPTSSVWEPQFRFIPYKWYIYGRRNERHAYGGMLCTDLADWKAEENWTRLGGEDVVPRVLRDEALMPRSTAPIDGFY